MMRWASCVQVLQSYQEAGGLDRVGCAARWRPTAQASRLASNSQKCWSIDAAIGGLALTTVWFPPSVASSQHTGYAHCSWRVRKRSISVASAWHTRLTWLVEMATAPIEQAR